MFRKSDTATPRWLKDEIGSNHDPRLSTPPDAWVRAYVQLKRDKRRLGAEQVTDKAIQAFRGLGFDILSWSSFHVSIEGSKFEFEHVFNTRLRRLRGVSGGYLGFARRYRIPWSLEPLVRNVILDGPTESLWGWPDPDEEFVQNSFQGKVPYKSEYDIGANTKNLLFLSDIPKLVSADTLHSQGMFGDGATIFMLDTGVDLDQDFFKGNNFNIVFLGSQQVYEDEPLYSEHLAEDFHGHGTMCAAGALAIAPDARLVMVTSPTNAMDPDGKPLFGKLGRTDLLSGLARAVDEAKASGPALISISQAIRKSDFDDFDDPDQAFLNVVEDIREIVLDALQDGVVVFSSAGNEIKDVSAAPGQMEEVVSVGGAWPSLLNPAEKEFYWAISNFSLSGEAQYPLAATPGVERSFPDLCGVEGSHGQCLQWEYSCTVAAVVPCGNVCVEKSGRISICTPVSFGMTDEEWHQFVENYPPTPEWYDYVKEEYGTDDPNIVTMLWDFLVLSPVGKPLDSILAAGGDWTQPNDGWMADPGGTSFATATVAGIVALVMGEHPLFPYGYMEPPFNINDFVKFLGICCNDVSMGTSASGDAATEMQGDQTITKRDNASGWGVLNAQVMMAYINAFEPWIPSYSPRQIIESAPDRVPPKGQPGRRQGMRGEWWPD